ncbi:MAG: YHS domain-containing protein [Asgard group archaeon]|nr:YHS domain-containing protein [Asgard group archaeon]
MATKTCCGAHLPKNIVKTAYKGKTLYFCQRDCLIEFVHNPEVFLASNHFKLDFEELDDA